MVCKYLLPFSRAPLCVADGVRCAELPCDVPLLVYFCSCSHCLWVRAKQSPSLMPRLTCASRGLWFLASRSRLWCIWVNFCVWCNVLVQFDSLACGRPVLPSAIYWGDRPHPVHRLASFVVNSPAVYVWLCFWLWSPGPSCVTVCPSAWLSPKPLCCLSSLIYLDRCQLLREYQQLWAPRGNPVSFWFQADW